MHLGMEECPVPFSGHCDLDLESIAYHSYFLKKESQTWCIDASLDGYISCTIFGSL